MAPKRWTEIIMPFVWELRSPGAYPLSRHQAPTWTERVLAASGAVLTYLGGPCATSTCALSTGCANAILTFERTHPDAAAPDRVRYTIYPLVQVGDGRLFQCGPKNDVGRHHPGLRHHEANRAPLLQELYRNSTSAGW